MKEYIKEIIILLIQIGLFYFLPLTAGPADIMGLIVLLLFSTLITGFLMGLISGNKVKFIYPIMVSLLFIPSIYIYYNNSALVHALWYLVLCYIGLIIGIIVRFIIKKIRG